MYNMNITQNMQTWDNIQPYEYETTKVPSLPKKMFGTRLLDIIKIIQHLRVHVKVFNIQENVNILNII